MTDMTAVIQPKSDQVNADDFIAGPATFTIESVSISPGTEQPVQIKLVGEPRVWRPCKSMSRVLVAAWGPDAKVYTGRSLTLYRDPKVKWGGMEVGGIRVSHLRPWLRREHLYEHAHVRLHFFEVAGWEGGLDDRVHSALAWVQPDGPTRAPMLPANGPILKALRLPRTMASRCKPVVR